MEVDEDPIFVDVSADPILGRDLVEISGHAVKQMRIRGITQREVLATVRRPDETGLPTQENRERVRKFKKPTKAIDVVYEMNEDRMVIVTTFPKKFSRRHD